MPHGRRGSSAAEHCRRPPSVSGTSLLRRAPCQHSACHPLQQQQPLRYCSGTETIKGQAAELSPASARPLRCRRPLFSPMSDPAKPLPTTRPGSSPDPHPLDGSFTASEHTALVARAPARAPLWTHPPAPTTAPARHWQMCCGRDAQLGPAALAPCLRCSLSRPQASHATPRLMTLQRERVWYTRADALYSFGDV